MCILLYVYSYELSFTRQKEREKGEALHSLCLDQIYLFETHRVM